MPATPGRILLEASATNAEGQVGQATAVLKVFDPADVLAPAVTLDGTLNGVQLGTATDIIGSVSDSNLDGWTLEMSPLGSDTFTTLAEGHTPVAGALARLDPGALRNGAYRIRLTAVDIGGRSAQTEAVVEANSPAKPSQYLTQATDLTAQLGGIALPLVRVYDSLVRD